MRSEGGEVRRLTSVPSLQSDVDPAFSPDGKKLLFVHEHGNVDCDLQLLDLNPDFSARGPARQITSRHAGQSGGVAWSADGRDAVWALSESSMFKTALYRVPITVPGPAQLLSFGADAFSPAIARHGNRLAYSRSTDTSHIWRAVSERAELHPASSSQREYNPRFSPDGKRIAFESDRAGNEEIWVANADGGQQIQVTTLGRHSGAPAWSADGRWIVFDSFGAEGRWDIWVVDAGGGTPRRLTNGPRNSNMPDCSPDGKWVYFNSNRNGRGEIFRVPLEGGTPMQVTQAGGGNPRISADSKTVYYPKSGELWRASVAGGEEQPAGIKTWPRAYQVGSEGVYFIAPAGDPAQREFDIRLYDFAKRAERSVQKLGSVAVSTYGLAVSPDRRTFLFTVTEGSGTDIMLVENFR